MGSDPFPWATMPPRVISTHAPRMGSDGGVAVPMSARCEFQPTLPVWGATRATCRPPCRPSDFNPRSPYGERQVGADALLDVLDISTHAPRMGSDRVIRCRDCKDWVFQPTLPVWGATAKRSKPHRWRADFNPRSPYGERLGGLDGAVVEVDFNPRSPYGERLRQQESVFLSTSFQPTLPIWGATMPSRSNTTGSLYFNPRSPYGERQLVLRHVRVRRGISTHAPRMGSDMTTTPTRRSLENFNPRSPYGERPTPSASTTRMRHFNPRSPYGERPRCSGSASSTRANFNPRSPYGERRGGGHDRRHPPLISTHAPRMGSDGGTWVDCARFYISTHAPRMGSDMWDYSPTTLRHVFQPTLPVWGATAGWGVDGASRSDFNPRSPYGERPPARGLRPRIARISTHAPRMGSDRAGSRTGT